MACRGEGQRALLLSDVPHSAAELSDPAWETVFDEDRAAARRVRERLIGEVTDAPDLLAVGRRGGGSVLEGAGSDDYAHGDQGQAAGQLAALASPGAEPAAQL